MTKIIDKRGRPLTHTFGELEMLDFFQDTNDNLCVKVGVRRKLERNDGGEWVSMYSDTDELIIPLKATLTIERGE